MLESHAMEIENAGILYSVMHKGEARPIEIKGEFQSKCYVDIPFNFNENGLDVSGVLVIIYPHAATKVLTVLHPSVRFEDAAVAGSGWFLGVNPEGRIVQTRLDTSNRSRDLIDYGAGWTFCWISDADGLVVLDTTEPAFVPSMEKEVVRGSESDQLSQEFWMAYDRLLSQ